MSIADPPLCPPRLRMTFKAAISARQAPPNRPRAPDKPIVWILRSGLGQDACTPFILSGSSSHALQQHKQPDTNGRSRQCGQNHHQKRLRYHNRYPATVRNTADNMRRLDYCPSPTPRDRDISPPGKALTRSQAIRLSYAGPKPISASFSDLFKSHLATALRHAAKQQNVPCLCKRVVIYP